MGLEDPSVSGVRPNRAMVRRALRVAQHRLANTSPQALDAWEYWKAAVHSLRWSLGETVNSPLKEREIRVDLEASRRAVGEEAAHAYECMKGNARPPAHVETMGYLRGVENTLHWVTLGSGFGDSLSAESLRLAGITDEG
jgi:hypothetical protein